MYNTSGIPAYRCLEAARSEATTDAGVTSDQYLLCLAVIGKGMLARECHRLDLKKIKNRKMYLLFNTQHHTAGSTISVVSRL